MLIYRWQESIFKYSVKMYFKKFVSKFISSFKSSISSSPHFLSSYWQNSGFRDKKLWEALLITFAITGSFYTALQGRIALYQLENNERSQVYTDFKNDLDRGFVKTLAHQELVSKYFDTISSILEKSLLKSKQNSEFKTIIYFKTANTLNFLEDNGQQKALILKFLIELNLVNRNNKVINLKELDFGYTDLPFTVLSNIDLSYTKLYLANLEEATLINVNLKETNLRCANLTGAHLNNVDMHGASLWQANLLKANLKGAKNLTPKQVKSAINWQYAKYDVALSKQLGLPLKAVGINVEKPDNTCSGL